MDGAASVRASRWELTSWSGSFALLLKCQEVSVRGGPLSKSRTTDYPHFHPEGDPARPNLARTRAQHSTLHLPVDRTQCAVFTHRNVWLTRGPCSPETVRCSHRLRQTIHDQDVTMVQLNRRGDTAPPATNLELHRMAQAHANYELRLILWAEQEFGIAVPGDA